jgi:alanyl-tRNA synthetase
METFSTPPRASVDIVERYLAFFREHGHTELPSSPLTLPGLNTNFVIAGMQPLMPYLLGQRPAPSPRLVGIQRCLRTDDADMVGSNGRKFTSFHMLGNWSIGDYGREEATRLAMDVLLGEFGLDLGTLWVTTFGGEPSENLPPDEEITDIWRRLGVPPEHIVPLGAEDNFWTTGSPGPCGPDSEIFVDCGVERGCGQDSCRPGCSCERFLEIWNLVFIEYEWTPSGEYIPLTLRSVDTGMGLERIAAVLQDVPSAFESDMFAPALVRLDELTRPEALVGLPPERITRARRMIVDHVRATLFAYLEGVEPGRDGRDSVVRRLTRRAARQGRVLGIEGPFLGELIAPLVASHGALLTDEERERAPQAATLLTDEERRFTRTLSAGLRYLDQLTPDADGHIPGERIFTLLAERGFPSDLAAEILADRGLEVDWPGYERALDVHREVSRAGHDGGAKMDARIGTCSR